MDKYPTGGKSGGAGRRRLPLSGPGRAATALVLVLAIVASSASPAVAAATTTASETAGAEAGPTAEVGGGAEGLGGAWGPVEEWPLIAIHAALDRHGRVVSYGTDSGGVQTGRLIYDRWTPGPSAAAGHQTLANTSRTDLFCSLQLNRVDTGDMLLFGGDNWTGAGTTNTGNPDINSLDPDASQLVALPAMNRARWYATGTTLPDGSIYLQGGDRGADRPERWSPDRGAELLDLDTSVYDWWYPRNFVVPDGRIFGIDIEGRMFHVAADLSSLTPAGQLPPDRRGMGTTAVMYRPGKILHFGGGSATAVVIDVSGVTPVVTPVAPLSSARRWVNGTLLPDGRVLATGGATIAGSGAATDIGPYTVTNSAEVWDPRTGRWTVQSSGEAHRLYHSTALLLPDGRVLVAGGGSPGPVTNTNAELFTPDYLVAPGGGATDRPVIGAVSSTDLAPGRSLTLEVGGGAGVARVTLVKAGSVTHSLNMEQRFVELPFTVSGATVSTTMPANEAHLVPGYWLLTVLDQAGVPSESKLVRVTSPAAAAPVTNIDGQIVRLYQAYFLRPPDDGGYRWWRRSLLAGLNLDAVSEQFAASPEFALRYGPLDDAGFVDLVYRNVLGREAEAEGRAYWRSQLARGVTRGQMMTAFSESAEMVALTATPPPGGPPPLAGAPVVARTVESAQLSRLYLGYFSRLPDETGLVYWQRQRGAGVTLATVSNAFAGSEEYRLRYGGTTDASFVRLVYLNVMTRAPDAGGLAYWIRQLAHGLTRGQLMIQFTESPEFVTRTAPLA